MAFIARVSLPHTEPPARGYVHSLASAFESAEEAKAYLNRVLRQKQVVGSAEFVLAAVWGDRHTRIAELFGYCDISEWPGNPEVYSWVFEDGVYKPEKRNIACGQTMQVLGREEDYRLTTASLPDYMAAPPHCGSLEPPLNL